MSGHHLDPVARLRIMAAAYPGCARVERVLDAPFDAVWAVAGDLEQGVPRFDRMRTRQRRSTPWLETLVRSEPRGAALPGRRVRDLGGTPRQLDFRADEAHLRQKLE
jgi:hypothetical protein